MHSIPFSKIFFRLTFALLEDTGWYQPNYEYAHEISWGRGMGCEFAQKSCMEMMERNDRHFCQDLMSAGSSKTTCTFDSTCRLNILFLSNHNINKSSSGLCFWASDALIERFW